MEQHELLTGAKKKRSFIWLVVVLFILTIAAAAILFEVKAYKDSRSAETIPVDAPEASGALTTSKPYQPDNTPTAADPTPGPTPSQQAYVKTALFIDGQFALALTSRQAAEELVKNVELYFTTMDTIPEDSFTVLLNFIKLAPAEVDTETVDYDTAFAYLTGSDTPLTYQSRSNYFQYEVIPHNDDIIYTDLLPAGYRLVALYGADGKIKTAYTTVYLNGVVSEQYESDRSELFPAVNGIVYIGTNNDTDAEDYRFYGIEEAFPEDFKLTAPIEGTIEAVYGYNGSYYSHGIDFACEGDLPVKAAYAGTVVSVMERGAYGIMIDIDHGGGVTTRYSRLGAVDVQIGDTVEQGDVIGSMYRDINGSYLHFELRLRGLSFDPMPYFAESEQL